MNTVWKSLRKTMFVLLALLAISVMVTGISAQSADEPACEGDYLESVREVGLTYIAALNANDLQPWIDVLAEDYVFHPIGGMEAGDKEESLASAQGVMAVFPGFQTEIHMSTVSSDCRYVTFLWTSTGIFGGPIGDIQPTGQETSVSGISVTEVEDGQIVSEWVSYDQLTLLSKLGLVTLGPPADAAVEATMEATAEETPES
jgi:predicted ester cyclase